MKPIYEPIAEGNGEMLVKPVYKCLLCGRLLTTGQTQNIPYDDLPHEYSLQMQGRKCRNGLLCRI